MDEHDLIEAIRNGLSNICENKWLKIGTSEENAFWIFRTPNEHGVAIEVPQELQFSEKFASARLHTNTSPISIKGADRHFLMLANSKEETRHEFSLICAQFVESGPLGQTRNSLMHNPEAWWKRWKSLLGNAEIDSTPHGVLGELLVLNSFADQSTKELSPKWNGPQGGSHDLLFSDFDIEVKSTTQRYGVVVTIAGQHQLECTNRKRLYIAHCRFEESPTGEYSIDLVAQQLKNDFGNEIEDNLLKLGLAPGCAARKMRFNLLGTINIYEVGDSFPRITSTSFKGERMPLGVVQLTYKVDLTSIPSEPLDTFIESTCK